jgi:hypothetical protein
MRHLRFLFPAGSESWRACRILPPLNPDNLDNPMRILYFVLRDRRGGYLPRCDFLDYWRAYYATAARLDLDPDRRRNRDNLDGWDNRPGQEAAGRIGLQFRPLPRTAPLSCTTRTSRWPEKDRKRHHNRKRKFNKKRRKPRRFLGYST